MAILNLVIQSFACADTQAVYEDRPSRLFAGIRKVLIRKLTALDEAGTLGDLALPGHRLEKLMGDRAGQYSIRVNDQYRLCFIWTDKGPSHVACVDYH